MNQLLNMVRNSQSLDGFRRAFEQPQERPKRGVATTNKCEATARRPQYLTFKTLASWSPSDWHGFQLALPFVTCLIWDKYLSFLYFDVFCEIQ